MVGLLDTLVSASVDLYLYLLGSGKEEEENNEGNKLEELVPEDEKEFAEYGVEGFEDKAVECANEMDERMMVYKNVECDSCQQYPLRGLCYQCPLGKHDYCQKCFHALRRECILDGGRLTEYQTAAWRKVMVMPLSVCVKKTSKTLLQNIYQQHSYA